MRRPLAAFALVLIAIVLALAIELNKVMICFKKTEALFFMVKTLKNFKRSRYVTEVSKLDFNKEGLKI
jgi:hypothetical protein